jgi:hypothetical protein
MRSLSLSILLLLFSSACIFGNDYTVNLTTDGNAANQLRGAVAAAVAAGAGPHTITIVAGEYDIDMGQISFGNNPITINFMGAGAESTIINMTTTNQNRIFRINQSALTPNVHVSFTGITFQNGLVRTDNFGGGAIRCGGPGNTVTINNCIFQNNSIDGAVAGTNGGAINMSGGGSLIIDGCTFFSNNTPDGDGGAIFYFLANQSGLLQITSSVFNMNSVTDANSAGGAIGIHVLPLTGLTTSEIFIQKNRFIANRANASGGDGGAISINNGIEAGNIAHINYNRFRGNTATNAATSAVEMISAAGNVDVTENWWGCNEGPNGAAGCDRAGATGAGGAGTLFAFSWLQLRTSSSAASICSGNSNNSSSITAAFSQNSAGATIDAVNLSALEGLLISFSPTLGNVSGAQTSIQLNGTATATFTSNGTTGTATVNARVDNVAVNDALATTSITVNPSPVINNHPAPETVCSGNEASFTVNASGIALSYNWFRGAVQLDDGPTISGSTIAGATTANLSIQNPGTADFGTNYNVRVTDHNGCPVLSNFTQLIVAPLVLLNTSGSAFHTITATDFALNDGSCERLALVQPSGAAPVNGVVGANLTIDADQPFHNGQPYVKRFYNISPAANASAATATITLYFLQSEFDSYNGARPGTENDLPTGPFDVTGRENLRVTQYHGNGTTPGTHTGWTGPGPAAVLINPGGGNVNWNSLHNWWEVTFPVTGFSGFFVTGLINNVLPVTVRRLTASNTHDGILIQWQVSNEVNFLQYEVETSHDGIGFSTCGTVPASNAGSYIFLHKNPVAGVNYYRLKLVDIDGNFSYSRTISALSGELFYSARILKNPFMQDLQLKIEVKDKTTMQLQLADLGGRMLIQKTISLAKGANMISLPEASRFSNGIYLLTITGGDFKQIFKVVKTQ